MLFPAVHQLGYQIGQKCYHLLYVQSSDLPTFSEILKYIVNFPNMYREWWLKLVIKDPLHVAVETTLLISILYIILLRNTEGYKDKSEKLTLQEQEELLWEWKYQLRQPLAPSSMGEKYNITTRNGNTNNNSGNNNADAENEELQIIVQKQEGKWLTITTNNPNLVLKDSTTNDKSNSRRLSRGDKQQQQQQQQQSSQQIQPSSELRVLNFCNFDFLGFQTSAVIRDVSSEAMKKYGCGSCGPRGFYGTIDTHLALEESIAKFTNTDNAIMYSDGASTCTSTIAAFAKRGDLLVVDEGVYEPISTGCYLSRANVHWFRHNDMDDLEHVLKKLQQTDQKLKRPLNAQRRFIIVEGLYKNLGTIAPVDKIVELKHKYHYRLIVDESFSFGTLGPTGRGSLEAYGKKPMYDAEIITIALENSLGSIGGVTIGNEEVVDHQRLSGAGYCFSASAPPFTASAAIASLQVMEKDPTIVEKLQSNIRYMYQQLETKLSSTKLVVTSDTRSPIVVLQLDRESVFEATIMSNIMQGCLQHGIAIVATGLQQDYGNGTSTNTSHHHIRTVLAPCLRMTVSTLHTQEDMDKAIQTLVECAEFVTNKYPIDNTTVKS